MEIKLKNLTKVFPGNPKKHIRDTVAVNNLNIDIPDGKLVGLLGPSGCGKSTTLYMLSGLQLPTSGEVWFGDEEVTNLSPEKRGIGLVFQNYALYPHMGIRNSNYESDEYKEATSVEDKQEKTLDILMAKSASYLSKITPNMFVSPAFKGSSQCRTQVGGLMTSVLTSNGTDATIDDLFAKAESTAKLYL